MDRTNEKKPKTHENRRKRHSQEKHEETNAISAAKTGVATRLTLAATDFGRDHSEVLE